MSSPRDSPDLQADEGPSSADVANVPPGTARITQAMLATYEDLKRCQRQKDRLRADMLRLFDQGAEVEPGPLTLEVKEQEERRLSFSRLIQVVGQAGVEQLKSQIEPIFCRYLRVYRVVQEDPVNDRDSGNHTAERSCWGVPARNPR